MTALCGGGTSAIKPGVAGNNIVAAGVMTEALTIMSPWLLPIGLLVDAFLYDANAQCTGDPPALPVFTQADLSNCIGGVFNPNCSGTLAKVKTLLLRYFWFQWCKCDNGTPLAFTDPAMPAGISVPGGPGSSACFQAAFSGDPAVIASQTATRPYFPELLPLGTIKLYTDANGNPSNAVSVPVGSIQSIHLTGSIEFPAGVGQTWSCRFMCYDTGGALLADLGLMTLSNAAGSVAVDQVLSVPPTTAYLSASVFQWGTTPPITTVLTATYTCGASSPLSLETPCAPDTSTLGILQQLMNAVKLLQRQLVPFAYIDGPAHAGLSGTGSFAVSGLLGVRWELTTLPATFQQDASVPPYIFNAGWVSLETADGFVDETRVHAEQQVWMPRVAAASQATIIGYRFAPGIVATMTELQRGI
jgi:hypothetical protein